MEEDYARVRRMVERLISEPERLPFPSTAPRLVETHISWVLLCGEDVLKIKKPVHMGFIDFSTLARRDRFAHEELRLNRRLAPELYIDVLRICGSHEDPEFEGEGPLLESVVHMRQFDPAGGLDIQIARGLLTCEDMVDVAARIADFQQAAPRPCAADDWGRFETVMAPIRENFVRVREAMSSWQDTVALARDASRREALDLLEARGEAWGEELAAVIEARREQGFVREGHGDLHLGNIARTRWGIRAFDCLEFAPNLRWIDVVCDLAFLFMDLTQRGRGDLAWELVNAWGTRTGDWLGLGLLRFYALYRTMVRVKVASLRRGQVEDAAGREMFDADIEGYLALADGFAGTRRPLLVLTQGLSGSGKSHLAVRLARARGAVHLRSDVERKRLLAAASGAPAATTELYGANASALTYGHLHATARSLLAAGLDVIVDATFLQAEHRARFAALAAEAGVTGVVLCCGAEIAVLEARIRSRAAAGADPSDADVGVLHEQLAQLQPLGDELGDLIRMDVGEGDVEGVLDRLAALVGSGEA